MRDTTLTELERLAAHATAADVPFQMDEDAFRAFYDRTARGLWAYLSRMTGDRQLADDLMQEAYYRFLRASRNHDSDAHRRNSLFQIATNLVRDARRRPTALQLAESSEHMSIRVGGDLAEQTAARADLSRAMAQLKPRERQMLWLAYAQGESHRDIAETLGVKTASIKMLLFRARRKLADLLRGSMMTIDCAREADLLDAIASGRWPDRVDAALREYVSACAICTDVAEVVKAFADEQEVAWTESRELPPANLVWLRAQARARADAAREAARPIAVMQALGFAGAAGVMSVLIGSVAWWVWSRTEWLTALPTARPESMDVMGLAIRGVLLAVGLWLVLAPVAVYLAAADE